ncbi:hypothetical protein SAMN05421844_101442 [Bosea robiniae]|uniref:Lipoprotein n=1 Tax=Bosea robiniae TaxID=1036780 RepID=A0ABY0NF34_9HYPH|nr:hypothetical protein SAMN05421844_101442 [Bosea robiniae]
MLMLTSVSAAGCGGRNAGDFCDVSSPTRPSAQAAAAMDRQDKVSILKHNEYGAKACGWR